MHPLDESEFDALPEQLRLLLVELARQELAEQRRREIALTPGQLAEAAGLDPMRLQREARLAMLKLQNAAGQL